MELNEFKTMFQSYNAKIEQTLKLNQHFMESLQAQKIRSDMSKILWQRIFEIAFHTISILLLLVFLFVNFYDFPYAVSALLLLAFYGILFTGCLRQIFIIKQMDYSNDIVSIQSSLVMLQTNILTFAKLTVLCVPVLLAYPIVISKALEELNITIFGNFDLIASSHGNWWTAQIIASVVLIPLGIWIYRQVNYKNINKEWVRAYIETSTSRSVRKSLEFLKELQSLKA
jgi:hypothetical protein